MLRSLFLLATALITLGMVTPAHAEDGFPTRVLWISTDTGCAKAPGSVGGVDPEDVVTNAVTGTVYPATGVRDAYHYGGHRQV